MTSYTAYFRNDAEYASETFEAKTPDEALAMARGFLDDHSEELSFESYDGGMAVDEIEIRTDEAEELAVWRSDELALRLAAGDLLAALEAETAAAQGVIDNWAAGDLAGAVRELDAQIATARAAIAKAKGGRS